MALRIPGESLAAVELRLMGRFAVLRDGVEVPAATFGGRKVRTLLRMLAVRRGHLVLSDVLADGLWPDDPPADPAANLQVLVNRARRAVGRPELIVTGTGGYALTTEPWCAVDTEVLLRTIATAERLDGAAALAAYGAVLADDGEPLPEDRYADWAQPHRSRVLVARQGAWERAASLALAGGDAAAALPFAEAAASAEPLRESAVLLLVRSLAATGDRAGALSRYDTFRRALADELGLDPSAAAVEVQRSLLGAAGRPTRLGELRFVGRSSTVDSIVAALPGVVRVEGRSGTGKSRLLAEVSARVPCLVVRARWPDRDEPASLTRSILLSLRDDVAALPPKLHAAVASVLPELAAAPPDVHFDPRTQHALVVEACLRLLAAQPAVLVVDDLQWTDPSSLRLLAAAVERAPSLLLAYRPEEVRPDSEVARLLDRLAGETVTVGALPVAAIADLIADPELAAAVGWYTDRTPMAISEVLRALLTEAAIRRDPAGRWLPQSAGVPQRAAELGRDGQRRAIGRRIAAHGRPVVLVLELLALLGREAPARQLAAAADISEAMALDHLAELATADLVHLGGSGWRPAHDMVAEAASARLSEGERGRAHGRLAAALDAHHADPAERARHWLAAGDAEKAAHGFMVAGAQALERVADVEATALAEAGLATGVGGAVRARLLETRAQARRRRGDIAGARDDLRAALEAHPAGPPRALLLAELATLAAGADDLQRAAEVVELAIVEAGDEPAAQARVLEVASIVDMNLARPDRSRERADAALATFTRCGDSGGIARILDARAMATFLHGDLREGVVLLDRAANLFEDSGDLMRTVTPRSTCGHGRALAGDPAAGLVDVDRALETARTLGHPEGQAYALWHRAEVLCALDRTDEARQAGEEALAVATRIGHRGWTATSWRAIGLAHQSAGALDEALAAYRASLEHAANLDLFACWAAARAAIVCVALGRLDEAALLVERASSLGPPLGQHEARWAAAELTRQSTVVRDAIAAAEAAGASAYLPRLRALAGHVHA